MLEIIVISTSVGIVASLIGSAIGSAVTMYFINLNSKKLAKQIENEYNSLINEYSNKMQFQPKGKFN